MPWKASLRRRKKRRRSNDKEAEENGDTAEASAGQDESKQDKAKDNKENDKKDEKKMKKITAHIKWPQVTIRLSGGSPYESVMGLLPRARTKDSAV